MSQSQALMRKFFTVHVECDLHMYSNLNQSINKQK